ncbi:MULTISPECIES: hypothetical protein [unclassified Sphingobacterium]|uniref:hypothetical protein n=1 Tax=unclassified Sphingobacterium TaxID=2609468 RepID=UPI0020C4482B|nr:MULTISPECIES: hypothetical protein [unclassified Sphingobacterium]MBV2225599.1 hypothetical protein [Sphingobacterium mizutaii]
MKKLILLTPVVVFTLLMLACTNTKNMDNQNKIDQPIDTADRLDSVDSARIDSTLTEQPINPVE